MYKLQRSLRHLRVLSDGVLFVGGLELADIIKTTKKMENNYTKKIKVLTLGDHPLLPSGVGTQTKYICEALLSSGKFEIYSLAGAVKHQNYDPITTAEYQEKWIMQPVDGYGNKQQIREVMKSYKPDMIWFMTDPRFYEWLWDMEDELRQNIPLVYYHVWDNYPYPVFNKRFYESNDAIATISKVTSDIVKNVAPEVQEKYIPHAVHPHIFRKIPDRKMVNENRQKVFEEVGIKESRDLVFFWNNRNARRKQPGSLLKWYSEFLEQDDIDRSRVSLIIHSDPNDPHGQPLVYLAEEFGIKHGEFILSANKFPPQHMAMLYNVADCTINIADAEGFGLSSLESLACGTPVISTMTGGLQEQVTNGEDFFGVGIYPSSRAVIGSQQVPYIYEDRISGDDFKKALSKIYHMSKQERETLGEKGLAHVQENYNFQTFCQQWVDFMIEVHEKNGSYETRKNHKNRWGLIEL